MTKHNKNTPSLFYMKLLFLNYYYGVTLSLYINYQLSGKVIFWKKIWETLELNLRLSYYVINNKTEERSCL